MAIQQPERADDVVRGGRPDSSWVRVGRGLHRLPDHDAFMADLRAWQAVLPSESCFTHVTALRARGLWVPQLPRHTPVFASMSRDDDRLRRPEIRTIRHTSAITWTVVDGVRVAVAAEAVLVCARDLSPLDLVVVADGTVHLEECSLEELTARSGTRRWGAPALRRVLPLVDGRSESVWETLLRLFHRCAQVPVEPQVRLFDESGRFVARADLMVRGRPWVHEYDGAGHRDHAVHAADLRRERAMLGIGYVRRGFHGHRPHHESSSNAARAGRGPGSRARPGTAGPLAAPAGSVDGDPGRHTTTGSPVAPGPVSRGAGLWSLPGRGSAQSRP